MLRYYAIATVIVLAVAVLATAWSAGSLMRLHFRSSNRPQPQQHLRFGDTSGVSSAAIGGDAPWALSALPDCFIQRTERTGSTTYVDAHLPRAAVPVAPGTRLTFGPCTIFVGNGELFVRRGADHMRVPPHAVLYRDGSRLLLLRTTGSTAVLRGYDITAKL